MTSLHIRVCALMGVALLSASSARAQYFTSTFETPNFLQSDAPPGPWVGADMTQASLTATSLGRHRGTAGLRVVDSTAGDGGFMSGAYLFTNENGLPNQYWRTWFRMESGTEFEVYPIALHATVPAATAIELRLFPPTLTPYIFGFEVDGGGVQTSAGADLEYGRWYLIEMSINNVGSSNASHSFYIDGQLRATSPMDFSGATTAEAFLGEPWGDDAWTGTMSFDDARLSNDMMASTLVPVVAATIERGQCVPLTVELRSSDGALAPAPYDVPVALSAAPNAGAFFTGPGCTSAASTVLVLTGASTSPASFIAGAEGPTTIRAEYVDFVNVPVAVVVSPVEDAGVTSPVDAGVTSPVDAGVTSPVDAGVPQVDAGKEFPDAGVLISDAGDSPDAGGLDELPPESFTPDLHGPLQVRCGCEAGSGSVLVAAWVVLLLRSRARSTGRFARADDDSMGGPSTGSG